MCVHEDFPASALRLLTTSGAGALKSCRRWGRNAYRTAHSPVTEAFYDDADRMGMLVMAETRTWATRISLKLRRHHRRRP